MANEVVDGFRINVRDGEFVREFSISVDYDPTFYANPVAVGAAKQV